MALPRTTARAGLLAMAWIVAASASACDSPAAAPPAFDLVDGWVGTFQGQTVSFPVRIDVESQQGSRLFGSGTAFERSYEMAGRYDPPTVYFRLTSSADTIAFVGEMFAANLVSGTLALDWANGSESGRVVLTRR